MINDLTVLAVIPARGGSKRTPRKNIRQFRGKPLLVWSIEAAKQSKYIDMLVVSSEDQEILQVALAADCFINERPPELATDESSNEDVLRYCLRKQPADIIVLLQPTSPLRTAEDIDLCIERAMLGEACISYRRDKTKNGAVYVARRAWIERNDFSNDATMRYYMPDERSLDVDYPEQFE